MNNHIRHSSCQNFSAYARKVLLNPNMTFLTIDTSNYQDLVFELHRIGNNINQIAKTVNQTKLLTVEQRDNLKSGIGQLIAEVLINLKSHESERRRLACYEFSKLNLTEGITLEQIEREILENQDQLIRLFGNYEEAVRKLESFVEVLNRTGVRPRETHDKELD